MSQLKTDNQTEVGQHVFEKANLGAAPYRFIGARETLFKNHDGTVRAGGACDYCGTCVATKFFLRAADGKEFGVGCDCILKSGDKGLIVAYKNNPQVRAVAKAKRDALAARKRNELADLMQQHADKLAAMPAGKRWDGTEQSQLDYLTRVVPMCGAAGRARYLAHVKRLLAQ